VARLVVIEGKAPAPVRELGEGPCVVGRLASCGLQLEEPQASRKHFQVERRGSRWALVHLASTNKTLLNGEAVEGEALLSDGDQVRVGDTVVAFRSAPEPLPGGTRVGSVTVVEEVGRSPAGGLYVGRQGALEREVLLEVVDPDLARDPAFRRRYEARARAAGALEHACVQAVFDTSSAQVEGQGERLYTVFEACPGVPLERRLETGPAFDREAGLAVLRDLAQGLAHVHARGQVHGVLSPLCVVVDGARVKLAGLGEPPGARLEAHRRDAELLARYASPEEARGGTPTAASDVYALGVLALHLLTGQPPYEGAADDVLAAHAAATPVPLPGALEPELAQLLGRALAKVPGARPGAAEVERELAQLIERRARPGDSRRRAPVEPARRAGAAEERRRDSGRLPGAPRRDSARAARPAPAPPTLVPVRLALLATGYALVVLVAGLATRIALRFL
jgi:serine/threonine protein kinase